MTTYFYQALKINY